MVPTLAIIVGLHFLALAPFFRSRSHAIIGVTMCLMAGAVMVGLPQRTAARTEGMFLWGVALGIGNAILLWTSALRRVVSAIRAID